MKPPLWLVLLSPLFIGSCANAPEPDQRGTILSALFSSTVQIKAQRPGGVRRFGSGVVLLSEGERGRTLVLTAGHVVLPRVDQKIQVVGPFRRKRYDASILAAAEKPDLALIEVHGMKMSPVRFAADGQVADDVWIVSFPWGRRRTVVNGVVSQIEWRSEGLTGNRIPLSGPVTLVDASASFGTSGGGVFRVEDGRLLGIVRGYRTITVKAPDGREPFKLPVGGETTVVSVREINSFLESAGHAELARFAIRPDAEP